jgi:hypothetical protein
MELERTTSLWLDWIDNRKPLLLGSLTQIYVGTHKGLCHASTVQIQCDSKLQRV